MDWRSIKGYEGCYEVSNTGVVVSLPREIHFMDRIRKSKRKILKHNIDKYGYAVVTLYLEGVPKTLKIHRIVLESFTGTTGQTVNHKDCNKLNNHLDNLEWATISENNKHRREYSPFDISRRDTWKNTKISLIERERIKELHASGVSYKEIGRMYKIHPHTIFKILKSL